MKRKVFYFLKFYLGFTKRESRGFLLIMPTLILLYFIPIFYQRCVNKANEQEYEKYLLEAQSYFTHKQQKDNPPLEIKGMGLVKFNPNEVDKDFLIKLGIEERTASNWEKYARSGAQFRTWEDLRKVYGLEEAQLIKLKDHMVFDTIPEKKEYKRPASPAMAKIPFSETDSITLQIVPGIGNVMAGRIIKFRENIGGLHHRSQLLDVYGVDADLVDRIFDHFIFDPGINRKIDINGKSINELAQHPYISYAQAKVIVAYRDQHGPFLRADDLLKIKIFTKEWLDKLEPYLDF